MIDEKNVVILSFSSRSSVFALHEALKKSGIDSRIISTPAVAKMACGLSVEVDGKDFQKAKSLALSLGLKIKAVFATRRVRGGQSYVRIQNL